MAGFTITNGEMLRVLLTFIAVVAAAVIGLEHLVIWVIHHVSLGWTK